MEQVVLEAPRQEEEGEVEDADTMKLEEEEEAGQFKEPSPRSTFNVVSLNMDILALNPENLKLVEHMVDQFKEKISETGARCIDYIFTYYLVSCLFLNKAVQYNL